MDQWWVLAAGAVLGAAALVALSFLICFWSPAIAARSLAMSLWAALSFCSSLLMFLSVCTMAFLSSATALASPAFSSFFSLDSSAARSCLSLVMAWSSALISLACLLRLRAAALLLFSALWACTVVDAAGASAAWAA